MNKSDQTALEKSMKKIIVHFLQDNKNSPKFEYYGNGAWNFFVDPSEKNSFYYSFIGLIQRLKHLGCEPKGTEDAIKKSDRYVCEILEKELDPLMKEICIGEKYKESFISFDGQWQFFHSNVLYTPKSYERLVSRMKKIIENKLAPA